VAHRSRQTATVVLVHGMYHQAWCWTDVVDGLRKAGILVIAPDLPRGLTDKGEDAATNAVLSALHDCGRGILCGHSAGGREITLAGEHPAVERLVYIAAMMPDRGESLAAFAREAVAPPSRLAVSLRLENQRIIVDPKAATELFYHDCSPERAAWAISRLKDEPLSSGLPDTVERVGWRTRPSHYVVCTEDRALAPAVQRRLAERATACVEWPTGHSPFLARPELVVQLLTDLARDGAT